MLKEETHQGKLTVELFYIYADAKTGQFTMDSTDSLSEAMQILDEMKSEVPWACINFLGRTVALVRDGHWVEC